LVSWGTTLAAAHPCGGMALGTIRKPVWGRCLVAWPIRGGTVAARGDRWPRFLARRWRAQIADHAAADAGLPPGSRGDVFAQLSAAGSYWVLIDEVDAEVTPRHPDSEARTDAALEAIAARQGLGPLSDAELALMHRVYIFRREELTRLPAGLVDPPV
jgi:hypothetical protein